MPDGINTHKIPYRKVVKNIENSRCILEIANKNSNGSTMRAIEAIVYDKYLITDNKIILKNKYYNTDMVKIVDLDNIKDDDFDIPNHIGSLTIRVIICLFLF